MRILLLLVAILNISMAHSQVSFKKFQWASSPTLHTVEAKFSDEAAVYIEDKKVLDFVSDKNEFFLYKTIHRIIHINSDKGIEMFNKIYLPFSEGVEMIEVKARTILPNKKIIELDEKNIKEIKEDDTDYKIFALEGLSKGCEVEYYYTFKTYPSYFGKEFLSYRIPVQKSTFELSAPGHLKFETKTYNGIPNCTDTLINEKQQVSLTVYNLDADQEEKYAMFDANIKRVDYRLSYNLANSASSRLFSWNELAKKAHIIYTTINEKEGKRIKELVNTIGIKENMPDAEKITRIENYLKKNFLPREDISSEDAEDLTKAIKSKVMSERAFTKIFCALYNAANVKYQIVLCGDRNDYTIERNFENWNNAKNLLLYFPSTKNFIAPDELAYRYPWIPPTWAGNNGMFCVETALGGIKSAYAEIKIIPFQQYQHSYSNLDVKAEFIDKNEAVELDVKHSYGGYSAANYRVPFAFYPAEEQQQFVKEIIKSGTNSENILSQSFENKEMEQEDPYKPLVIKAKVKSTKLVEQAGQKIILKVGDIIGEQAEMYDTKQRKSEIALHYPHALIRNIEIKIPDGYEVKNPTDLNFNITETDNGQVTLGFVSSYEIKGNILSIVIKEDYVNHYYPMQAYETFKKVINAAADFNKVTLILDKKG